MTNPSSSAAARSAVPSLAPASAAIAQAARLLLPDLERGRRIDAGILRAAMESTFGASDAAGAWDWKTAYDAGEAATVLFLRKYGNALFRKAASPVAALPMLAKIASLLPTYTRRSEESQALQQFSTPIPLGVAACAAAAITPADRVLEPSAGTGLLAILAELAGGSLVLNELAEARAAVLDHLFPSIAVTRFDAAQIDDHLDAATAPSVVLMNPPFSAMANVDRRMADAALRHVTSALARLCEGGRLVAITGSSFAPDNPAWTDAFACLQERARLVFSAAIDGAVYAKHGTTIDTRLLVIDKQSDVYIADQVWLPEFYEKGFIADVSKQLSDSDRADFSNTAIETVTYKGAIVALPIMVHNCAMYYRKDLLGAAGLSGPPKSWDAYRQMAKATTKGDVWGTMILSKQGIEAATRLNSFYQQAGGDILDKDGHPTIDTDAGRAALDFMSSMVFSDKAAPEGVLELPDMQGAWLDAKLALAPVWPYLYSLSKKPLGDRFAIGTAPGLKRPGGTVYSWGFAAAAGSKNPEAAAAWVKWATSTEQLYNFGKEWLNPVPRKSALDKINADPSNAAWRQAFSLAGRQPGRSHRDVPLPISSVRSFPSRLRSHHLGLSG